jgi:hypothetical protein
VYYNNNGSDFKKVKTLILEGMDKALPLWPKLVERAMANEEKYISNETLFCDCWFVSAFKRCKCLVISFH